MTKAATPSSTPARPAPLIEPPERNATAFTVARAAYEAASARHEAALVVYSREEGRAFRGEITRDNPAVVAAENAEQTTVEAVGDAMDALAAAPVNCLSEAIYKIGVMIGSGREYEVPALAELRQFDPSRETAETAAWDAALAAYKRAQEASDLSEDDDTIDAVLDAEADLEKTPAPHLWAVLTKLAINACHSWGMLGDLEDALAALASSGDMHDVTDVAVYRDIERLAAKEQR